jgi:hypothetical protein
MFVPTSADGVPRAGVTSVGDVANTADPLPVSSVKAVAKLADVNDPSNVAFPVDVIAPVKLALVVTFPAVRPAAVPVMFVPTKADGVPRAGVTSVGDVANTKEPEPVSSDTAEAKFAELGVAKNVATPVPKPLIPVLTGSPVAFVNVTEVGVPNKGVISVGDVAKTLLPVPVLVTLTMFLLTSSARAVEAVRPDRVAVLLALSVVNAPVLGVVAPTVPLIAPANAVLAVMVVPVMAAGAVPPMAGGEAKKALKPAPLTVELALSVVNAPVLAVVAPTVPFIGPANPPAVIVPTTLPAPLK